jgi:hypothetical protein
MAVAVFTGFDSTQRRKLESIEFPTSAGDKSYFAAPAPLVLSMELVRQEGVPFCLSQTEPFRLRDVHMLPAGRDDSGKHLLYQRAPLSENEPPQTGRYLKIGRDVYLAMEPRPESAGPRQ